MRDYSSHFYGVSFPLLLSSPSFYYVAWIFFDTIWALSFIIRKFKNLENIVQVPGHKHKAITLKANSLTPTHSHIHTQTHTGTETSHNFPQFNLFPFALVIIAHTFLHKYTQL